MVAAERLSLASDGFRQPKAASPAPKKRARIGLKRPLLWHGDSQGPSVKAPQGTTRPYNKSALTAARLDCILFHFCCPFMLRRRIKIPALRTLRKELVREERLTAQALRRVETFFAQAPNLFEERARREIIEAAEERGMVAPPQFAGLPYALRDPRTRGGSPSLDVSPQRAPRLLRRRRLMGALFQLILVLVLFALVLWWVAVLYD